jgi:3',5'-cyclic-AMP phosphodiesterase
VSGARAGVTVIAQLSDLHLRADDEAGERAGRLRAAVARVAELEPRPSAVLLSGDLADEPLPAAYEQAHELLAPLGVPLHAIPGNHDDRELLRARFGPEEPQPGAHLRFAVRCGALRLVGLDSTVPGREAGALGTEQLEWLERTLAAEPDSPTLLALHHPPLATGLRVMDAIALEAADSDALEALLERHSQVLAVTCGHAHTAMTSTFAGRSLLVCPSTNSAVELDLRDRWDLPFRPVPLPLGFALHALVDGRLVSHVQPLATAPC